MPAPLNASGMLNVCWVHARHGARCCKATLLMLEQEVRRVQGRTLRALQQQETELAQCCSRAAGTLHAGWAAFLLHASRGRR